MVALCTIRIHLLVDFANHFAPAPPFRVLHLNDLCIRPVKVIGNKRYLFVELIRNGSASTFPERPPASSSGTFAALSSP
jgi:hypothetical protein